jgi:nicotinate-nucleotide adenylyltransferase
MKIGILGGTFDPIHNGHLMAAEAARSRLGLDEVVFVPAGEPYLKAGNPVSAAEHRVQMIRLALADKPHFKLSTVEIERPGPSYTVDTIAEMRAQLDREDELFFILGWGNLPQLPQWHKPARLIEMCYLVAVPRPGTPRPDLKPLEPLIPGLSPRVIFLDEPEIDISASAIRSRVARGLPIHHLVPEPVDKYIKEQGLYLSTG